MTLSHLWCSSVLICHILSIKMKKTITLHIIWCIKMKNVDKMGKNNNLAIICHKRNYLVIISIYNERKKDTITASGFFGINSYGPVAFV